MQLILASSSPYRRALLERLGMPFEIAVPDIDESPRAGECPKALVERLAETKAAKVAQTYDDALVIGSDQVAVSGSHVLGKPGGFERNVEQLTLLAGRTVIFQTGLCLMNSRTGHCQTDVVGFEVDFKPLTASQIKTYVSREQPYDCAGGFKSEGLGIALFSDVRGDATALVGLPLIRLIEMLASEGFDVLA